VSTRCGASLPSREFGRALALAALGFAVVACSDAGHRLGGGVEKAQDDPGALTVSPCAPGAQVDAIDDMEDQDGSIDFTAGRAGVWYVYNDRTGMQVPDIFGERFNMTALEPPRAGSHFAAHTSGRGFTEWGAGIGLYLRAQQAYDASGYAGISFWARRGPSSTSSLQLAVPDGETSPLGGKCDLKANLCHDDFGYDLELTEEFQYFSFTWAELVARNWSAMYLPGIDSSKIYGIQFQVDRDQDFDFWIDDLSFLCRTR